MKLSSGLFGFFLLVWMGGSTYWYVCKIMKDCDENETVSVEMSSNIQDNTNKKSNTEEFIEENNDTGKNTEEIKEEIINKTKEKLIEGYIIYDFPKNSIVNNNISNDFNEFAEDLKIYLAENNQDKIEIIGHTDDIGSNTANLKFGKKRALFIKNKLTEMGISDTHFIIKSKGEKEPLESNDTETGRKKNRRVVVKLSVK